MNTLSVLLLALAGPVAYAFSLLGAPGHAVPLLTAALILSITVSHTFINIVPGTYLGAPDESHALSILPAHRMLLRGQGYRAIRLSAFASFFALVVSLLLLLPAKWVLADPLHLFRPLQSHLFLILLVVAAYLVWSEPKTVSGSRLRARAAALGLFGASGLYGLLIFRVSLGSHVPVPPSPLLPALTGLFGAATLVESLAHRARIPHQFVRLSEPPLRPAPAAKSLLVGVAAGAGISLLPGLTNASATSVASAARRGTDAEILVSLSAVNTANAVFNLLMLSLFHRTRSGAVIALERILPLQPWTNRAPPDLLLLLFSALASAAASLAVTLLIGRFFARRIHAVPYGKLLVGLLAYMTLVVWAFTGATGLAIFATGLALGLIPVRLGLRRTHLTGVLLLPVLVYFWPR